MRGALIAAVGCLILLPGCSGPDITPLYERVAELEKRLSRLEGLQEAGVQTKPAAQFQPAALPNEITCDRLRVGNVLVEGGGIKVESGDESISIYPGEMMIRNPRGDILAIVNRNGVKVDDGQTSSEYSSKGMSISDNALRARRGFFTLDAQDQSIMLALNSADEAGPMLILEGRPKKAVLTTVCGDGAGLRMGAYQAEAQHTASLELHNSKDQAQWSATLNAQGEATVGKP
jgi:hypothetical protein